MKETTFEDKSGLKIFSLGIVIEGLVNEKGEEIGGDTILVSPIESMNIQQPGLMTVKKKKMRAGHPDEKGNVTKKDLEVQDYVTAKWISIGTSNRSTPPTVYPNETVLLYKYSNHDKFYWTAAMHEPHLRKKESAAFSFCNIPNEKGWEEGVPVTYDRTNSYWFEVNSFKKLVSLTTPDNDEEKAVYTFSIDGKTGVVTLKDDKGNKIIINTVAKSILVKTPGTIELNAGKKINIMSPNIYIGGGSINLDGDVNIDGSLKVGGDIRTNVVNCKSLKTGAGKVTVNIDRPRSIDTDKNDGGAGGGGGGDAGEGGWDGEGSYAGDNGTANYGGGGGSKSPNYSGYGGTGIANDPMSLQYIAERNDPNRDPVTGNWLPSIPMLDNQPSVEDLEKFAQDFRDIPPGHVLDPNPVTDWILGYSRPDNFYNNDGTVTEPFREKITPGFEEVFVQRQESIRDDISKALDKVDGIISGEETSWWQKI